MGKEKILWIIIFSIITFPSLIFSYEFTSFIYPKEIVLSILLLLLFPFLLIKKGKLFVPIYLIFLFFFNVFLLSGCMYAKVPEKVIIRSTELFLTFVTLLVLVNLVKDEKYDICIEYGILISGLLVSLSLIVQYFNVLPVLFPQYTFYKQLYSVFGNQNLAGAYIAIVMMGLLVRWNRILLNDICKFISFFILGYGLVLSNSRSSWFSFLVVCTIYILKKYKNNQWDKRRFVCLTSIMFLVILLMLPNLYDRFQHTLTDKDVGFRVRLWIYDGSIRMFLSNPFWGVGFGNFYYWSPKYLGDALNSSYGTMHFRNELLTLHAHNDILELLTETGSIGVLFVILFYLLPLFLYRNTYVWWVFLFLSLTNPILISSSHFIITCLSLFREEERMNLEEIVNMNKFLFFSTKTKSIIYCLTVISILFLFYALWVPDYKLRQAEKLLILGQDCEAQYAELVNSRFATYSMYEGYAQELIGKGKYQDAYKILQKALDKTDGGNIYLLLGMCAEELGLKEESERWYRECLYRLPDNKEAQDCLSFIEGSR